MSKHQPQIAIVGAGIFVKNQYIPRLIEISDDLFILSAIWSRSEKSARAAVELAKERFPQVECKWGDEGLDDLTKDSSIDAVAVVLAGQAQVDISLKLLKAGKHVIQEGRKHTYIACRTYIKKPAAASIDEAETALSLYNSLSANVPGPIWAVAENYRFEPAFVEGRKLVADIGDMLSIQVMVEGSMNSSNPYFSSSWRRNLTGGFILDMGVHFVAGLRMLAGCEITSVSALTSHVDLNLPPPDTISSIFQLENGCSGVYVMVVSSSCPKILWRVVGTKGALQIERGNIDGKHGYQVALHEIGGQSKIFFYPFSGVTDELKCFLHDVSQATCKNGSRLEAESRSSYTEGARDIAVLEAMLQSGAKKGAPVHVKKV